MKEDKMENIHLIFKFLWYSVLFCIWGVSCTSSGTYKKTQMDILSRQKLPMNSYVHIPIFLKI